jgi:hypothetical protein
VSSVEALVAVAVMFCPSRIAFVVENVNEASPDASVETDLEPRRVLLSSVPSGLEKNCSWKVLPVVLLRLPLTVVVPFLAEERRGLFCRPLGPVSVSPVSLAVVPPTFRSMPSRPSEEVEPGRFGDRGGAR